MGKTLLLADDSVTIQKVVGISFASEDISIVTVDNGDDAVARAQELRPDVILADVVMPGKSGYEVCQAVKADPNIRHVPVLLLTGTFEAFDEEHASAVGAAGHISKPFEAQTLVDRVKELLSSPAAAAPSAPSSAAVETPDAGQSFDFFEDAGDLASPGPATAQPTPPQGSAPISAAPSPGLADTLDIAGGDAFAFGDDDLGEPLAPLAPLRDAAEEIPDATVAIMPEGTPDLAATVVDESFLSAGTQTAGAQPDVAAPAAATFAFPEAGEPAPTGAGGETAFFDVDADDALAVSSSDLFTPEPEPTAPAPSPPSASIESVATPEPGSAGGALDPLLAPDALGGGEPLTDLAVEPLDADLVFATPIEDDPMEATAGPHQLLPPTPPVGPKPITHDPIEQEPLRTDPVEPEPFVSELLSPESLSGEPLAEAPGADSFGPEPYSAEPFAEPAIPAATAPEPMVAAGARVAVLPRSGAEVPVQAEPSPAVAVPVEPEPTPLETAQPPASADALESIEPLMAEAEPLMVPEGPLAGAPVEEVSSEAVNRLVERVTPALGQELHQTLERIAWESFGAVTEQLVNQAVERIESIAWEVVPKLAETLIQEEIRKLKGES